MSGGIDADTAEFAVEAIRSWWEHLGAERYPEAATLTITADCGGVSLIGATTSAAGLEVYTRLDERPYERGMSYTRNGTT